MKKIIRILIKQLRKNKMLKRILYHIISFFFRMRITKVAGLENIPKNRACILVSDHISYLDGPSLGSVFFKRTKRYLFFLTHKDVYKSFSLLSDLLGMIPATPEGVNKAIDLLNQGESIIIFPEGGINTEDILKRAHTGFVRIDLVMVEKKVPVIPVGITGPTSESPTDGLKFLLLPHLRKKQICIRFGEPIKLWKYTHVEDRFIPILNKKIKKYEIPARMSEELQEDADMIMKKISQLSGKAYPFKVIRKKERWFISVWSNIQRIYINLKKRFNKRSEYNS